MKAISGYFKGIWVPYLILSLSLTQNSLTGQKGEKGTKGRSGILGTRKQESRSKVVLTLRLRCSNKRRSTLLLMVAARPSLDLW